jgi:hypothetical protein
MTGHIPGFVVSCLTMSCQARRSTVSPYWQNPVQNAQRLIYRAEESRRSAKTQRFGSLRLCGLSKAGASLDRWFRPCRVGHRNGMNGTF